MLFQWIEWLKEALQLLPIHHSTLVQEEDEGQEGAADQSANGEASSSGGAAAAVMDEAARRQVALDFLGGIEVVHGEPYMERKVFF